ncbi:MAG: hypothetical protein V1749_09985 [Candidatus Desantisbacteria bacterium]
MEKTIKDYDGEYTVEILCKDDDKLIKIFDEVVIAYLENPFSSDEDMVTAQLLNNIFIKGISDPSDYQPPVIASLSPSTGTLTSSSNIFATITETGSGVGTQGINLRVDGKEVSAIYDSAKGNGCRDTCL